jgi:hypothetical protein
MPLTDDRIFTGEWNTDTVEKKGPAPEKFGTSAKAKYLWYKRYAVGTTTSPEGRIEKGTLMNDGEFIKADK